MDSATEELYFQKLQELVQDEDKIVTVASFASGLGISLQDSQKLIKKYVEDYRKLNSNSLAVTYILIGLLKHSNGKGVFMVKEEDLEEKQSLFENKPSKLIYSVQKTKNVDFNIIALVDMFDSTKIRERALEGAIVSKNCVKRVLKIKKSISPPPPTVKGKSSFFEPKPSKSTETNKSAEKQSESSKNGQKPKTSGNIASLFKAAASKSSQQNGEQNSTSTNSNKQASKRTGGLAGFLMNGATKSPKNIKSSEVKKENNDFHVKSSSNEETQDDLKKEEIMEIFDDDFEEQTLKTETPKKETPVKQVNTEKKKQSKKRQRDKSQDMPSKKRKRIVERNDSDSDDLFEREDEVEDIVEKSDDEPERISSPVRELPPKNKKRKAVEKTYKDEEGFVVTKTEYIYETASEDENEAPNPPKQEKQQVKVEKPKMKATEKKKPQKNQATLMNFFKKV